MSEHLTELLGALDRLRDDRRSQVPPTLLSWTVADWRRVLQDLPLDGSAFRAQFDRSWDDVIETLEQICLGSKEDESGGDGARSRFLGFAGLFLLTLVSLRHSERRRIPRSGHAPDVHDVSADGCRRVCHTLVRDPAVQEALRDVYAPTSDGETDEDWNTIDFSTLTFHRHGTTSFILRARPQRRTGGWPVEVALKCIIYPFLRIPAIRNASRTYVQRYARDVAHEPANIVRVLNSYDSWVLMGFIDGETLADRLAREWSRPPDTARPSRASLRLDLIEQFGRQLFIALAELERCGLEHQDLSPSNVLVVKRGDREELWLIDLGVNSLYLHQMPGSDAPDALYIAPELREPDLRRTASEGVEAKRQGPCNDLYSLGQLLILLGCGRHEPDGSVPDLYYADAPLIARFIEDLIDRTPSQRLLVFFPRKAAPGKIYESLLNYFTEEITAMRQALTEGIASGRRNLLGELESGRDVFMPLSDAVGRQLRLWRVRRRQQLYREHAGSLGLRWLLLCAVLGSCAWALTSAVIITWTARHTGWDWGNQLVVALQRFTGAAPDEFPILDQFRSPDYRVGPEIGPLLLGILLLSLLLVGVKYYVTLFATLTPLVVGWQQGRLTALAVATEVSVRLFTVFPLVLASLICLRQPRWWAPGVAVAMTMVLASNSLSYWFTGTALRRARAAGMSVVDPERVGGRKHHLSWVTGNIFHSLTLWVIGILLYLGVAKDALAYVILLILWNIQLYVARCVMQGPEVRAGIARACAAAERIKYIQRARGGMPPTPDSPSALDATNHRAMAGIAPSGERVGSADRRTLCAPHRLGPA
ncbi:MAG TPA: hypothetical protein VIL34_02920 [Actinopolymorphaceae bacterium]